jgi:hypothetical protein
MKNLFPELKQKPLHKEMRSIIIRIQIIIRVAVNNWFMHFFSLIFSSPVQSLKELPVLKSTLEHTIQPTLKVLSIILPSF